MVAIAQYKKFLIEVEYYCFENNCRQTIDVTCELAIFCYVLYLAVKLIIKLRDRTGLLSKSAEF